MRMMIPKKRLSSGIEESYTGEAKRCSLPAARSQAEDPRREHSVCRSAQRQVSAAPARDSTGQRPIARSHQKLVYAALLREATAAVQTLADDPTWVGGTLGILAVLHTWSRTLEYHPHAHLLVTARGLKPDG